MLADCSCSLRSCSFYPHSQSGSELQLAASVAVARSLKDYFAYNDPVGSCLPSSGHTSLAPSTLYLVMGVQLHRCRQLLAAQSGLCCVLGCSCYYPPVSCSSRPWAVETWLMAGQHRAELGVSGNSWVGRRREKSGMGRGFSRPS